MIGAIAGDIVGSVYEWDNIKTKDFDLFTSRSFFTDLAPPWDSEDLEEMVDELEPLDDAAGEDMAREFIRGLSNQLRLWLARDGVGRQYRMDFQCPSMVIFCWSKMQGKGQV
ncbi:hypothetical protein Dthio_PD2128 [Desulfonatronospira thiodismutans ASO3-1]|uniref:ADP-ribosylation/Crystallin J1 n=1 Tax=Desulfonatronospira thiodismutans ASO3-1 TaxID=555779 RepID=D6SPS6_9BACT|nr:hypothetical protein [Desulfonatronospira thiodismutans]EFI34752.1 hypothetical protein Dthio_PD2128 [Desulfonatronospira thiodismutans ASO3-1]